jgi:serralysin
VLVGGDGADAFQFTAGPGGGKFATITDFAAGIDRLILDDGVFAGIGALGAFNPNAFATGTAAQDADDRIIYDSATGALL